MIEKRGKVWIATLDNGNEIICISEEVAKQQILKHATDWKPWTPPELEPVEDLPLPEVREYDSLEDAIKDQDKDELDRFEDDLIAEED